MNVIIIASIIIIVVVAEHVECDEPQQRCLHRSKSIAVSDNHSDNSAQPGY